MYSILTLCIGDKYESILNHWAKRINDRCKSAEIILLNDITVLNNKEFDFNRRDIIWSIRLKNVINNMTKNNNRNVIMCDIDIIIEKDIEPLINLPYDIIWSREINGNKAYPPHCSNKLGFGICAGFGIFKQSSLEFLNTIFENMKSLKYNSYDDQVNIMEYIINSNYKCYEDSIILDNIIYKNNIIEIDNIRICVLDFNIIVRDPIKNIGQYANHINIDNVGGTETFIKYFYNDLKDLPLTCRCGKTWLGDYSKCTHLN